MSEHQLIAFRAIDGPVSGEDLEFMRRQSSRAEVTSWAFDNEYNYGDFRGNVAEMLRRGYDLHVHYANFGVRKLMIRLPNGLPDPGAAAPYLDDEFVSFEEDKKGPGGILRIQPCYEPGDLDDIWEFDTLVEKLLPLRGEIMDGDLRPLYLAHLAVACDFNHDPDEEQEGPVPAGLGRLTPAQRALAEFYGLDDALLAAAARGGPALPERGGAGASPDAWLRGLPEAKKDAWLARVMADAQSAVRRELIAEFRKSQGVSSWPTARLGRTVAALQAAAEEVAREAAQKKAAAAARKRAKQHAAMAADPARTLREVDELVAQRGGDSYRQAAELLAELREALAGGPQADLPEKQARALKEKHPTLRLLTSELKRKGFLK
jgi:hypothetical protein